jgi:hypothetical protein
MFNLTAACLTAVLSWICDNFRAGECGAGDTGFGFAYSDVYITVVKNYVFIDS